MPATTSPNTLATATDNGRNIRAELMPESFFFLDKNVVFSQNTDDKFGVVGLGSSSTFRTTSKIKYTGKVFTICQGQIFVQPTTGNDNKVNIVIKPFSQPVKGLAIKYIIYRGLDKSDFFSSDGKVVSNNATAFTSYIWQDFKKFNPNEPDFMQEYIGYPALQPDTNQEQKPTDLIDGYFFKVSQAEKEGEEITEDQKFAYELPLIPRGTHIGNVSGDQFLGIDIVLNEGDYTIQNDPNPFQLNLAFARSADHVLNPGLGDTDFKKKLVKESASWFIDIAAFYGLHTQGKGKVYVSGQTDPLTDIDGIYNLISKFKTSNTVYLYIQSNRQRSYNFYGNYQISATNFNNIKIGTTAENLLEKEFGTDGWPVEEINSLDNKGKAFFKFLYSKEINIPILYSNYTDIKSLKSTYFAAREELIDSNSNLTINYSNSVEFSYEVLDNNAISNIFLLNYVGVNLNENIQNKSLQAKNDYLLLHNIFPVINRTSNIIHSDDGILIIEDCKYDPVNILSYEQGFLVSTKTVVDFGKKQLSDTESIFQKRITFISHISPISDNINKRNSKTLNTANILEKDLNSKVLEFIYGMEGYSLQEYILKEGGEDFKTIGIKFDNNPLNEYFHLGITEDELTALKQLIPLGSANVRLKFKEDPNYNADAEKNVEFYKFSLGILYEGINGNLEDKFPQQQIFVYGLKVNYLTSKKFADFENKASVENIII